MKSIGELSATTKDAAVAASLVDMDHEEVAGWIKTILKAILEVLK